MVMQALFRGPVLDKMLLKMQSACIARDTDADTGMQLPRAAQGRNPLALGRHVQAF